MKNIKVKKNRKRRFVHNFGNVIRALIIIALVVLEIALLYYLSFELPSRSIYVYYALQVISALGIIGLVNSNRNESYKVSWMLIIAILPPFGYLIYLMWGARQGRSRPDTRTLEIFDEAQKHLDPHPENLRSFISLRPNDSGIVTYCANLGFPIYPNNKVTYFDEGDEALDSIFDDIQRAKRYIFLSFFILSDGDILDKLYEILLQKAKEGVEIKFLHDDFGSMFSVKEEFFTNLRNAGVEIRSFNPVHKYVSRLYFNYRSHQKVVVVDGELCYTGGINLADEYANIINRFGWWKDSAIRLEGDGVRGLIVAFFQMWNISGTGIEDFEKYRPVRTFDTNSCFVQTLTDGPVNNPLNPICDTYKQLFSHAKSVLYITTPYLVLEQSFRDILIYAAKSGVDVRIITPGTPDKKIVKLITELNYGELLKGGIRIYEYAKGFIHQKNVVADDTAIVGTVNLDYRSFYLHYEDCIIMWDRYCAERIKECFFRTLEDSREITLSEWQHRPFYRKILQYTFNLFQTLL